MIEIPAEAVEAAARAMDPAVWGPQVWQFMAHGETPTAARDRVQQQSLNNARAALEAAAPHIAAQAWDEGWDAGFDDGHWSRDPREPDAANPYREADS